MSLKLINVGYGNIVSATRIIAIVSPDSAPSKRLITHARDNDLLIDATCGRRTRAIIITDSSHIILSALMPETMSSRFLDSRNNSEDQGDDRGE